NGPALIARPVETWSGLFAEHSVFHVTRHTDHLERRIGQTALVKDLTDRRTVWPVTFRHRLVDHRDERPALDVALAQRGAGDDRNAERVEVASRNRVEVDFHILGRRGLIPRHRDARARAA